MSWLYDHWLILVLLVLYVVMLAQHARAGRRKTEGIADYYVGGRKMGGVAIGISFFATYSSTNSFIGFAGQSYSYGAPWLLIMPFVVVLSLLAWVVVAPRLRHFTALLGSLTLPDFIGFRFRSTPARVLAAVIIIFASLSYLTAVFIGVGRMLEALIGFPYRASIIVVFFIVVAYTAVGGFISVVKTDVVQGFALMLAAIFLFSGTVEASGGLDTLFDARAITLPSGNGLFAWDAALPFPVLVGILFAATIKFVVEPRQLSRFYALKDDTAVRRGMWISTISFLVVYAMLAPIGIYARNIYPTDFVNSDLVVPALLSDVAIFHPAVSAFMLVALIAAAMSSIDSVLLVMASTCHRDLVGLLHPSDSTVAGLRATAAYVALFAFITTIIALNPPGGIVALSAFSGSLYAACFFPALLLGLYWGRGNGTAVVASILVGLALLLLWQPLGLWPAVHEVFPALVGSVATYVVVAVTRLPVRAPELESLFGPGAASESAESAAAVADVTT